MRAVILLIAMLGTGCYGTAADDDDGAAGSGGSAASAGAGGTAGAGATGGSGPSCGEERYAFEGTIAGQPLTYAGALDGHAWIQGSNPSTLDTPFAETGSFHAEWGGLVADGQSTAISGWVQLPPGGTRGGETLDFASGTMVKVDAHVSFELAELSEEVVCAAAPCPAEPIEGSIAGCVEWTDF